MHTLMDCIWFSLLLCASSAAASKILTKYGPVEGTTVTIYNGEKVDAFLGVPYAAPPIGPNRFAPPQQPTPWNETLEAKSVSKSCFQGVPDNQKGIVWYLAEGLESEDCLYLNVWSPSNWQDKNMTVMVWIHPGGFYAGSASMPLYDGAILASEKKIVVVSMNYRLSIFGNLFLDSAEAPGNLGLQDQVLAMKWVNQNIHNFGGDPNRVTIFGESSGSISVSLHLLNNDISNLFQYGIMESGSSNMNSITITKEQALNYSITLGNSLGCPVNDSQQLISCLKGHSATDIMKYYKFSPTYGHFPFSPVRNGKEVPLNPFSAVKDVPFNRRKSLIVGNIKKDGNAFVSVYIPGKFLSDDLAVTENDMRDIFKYYLLLDDERLQNVILHEYRDFNLPYNKSQLRNDAINVITDTMFICPDTDFVKSYSSDSNDVFYYNFNYRPSRAYMSPVPEWAGAAHGDDIAFVFGLPLDPKNGYNDNDRYMSKEIMTFWVNFAQKGNPNGDGPEVWSAHKPNSSLTVLEFNQHTTMTSDFVRERQCAFWRDVYSDLLSMQNELQSERKNDPTN